jgi:ABC-type microcin C transport system duplicated ATPase subunit YejF
MSARPRQPHVAGQERAVECFGQGNVRSVVSRHDLELMVISHDLVLVAAHTGDVLALRDGRVLASGTTTRVLAG